MSASYNTHRYQRQQHHYHRQHLSISWQPSHGACTRGYSAPAGQHRRVIRRGSSVAKRPSECSYRGGRYFSITRLRMLAGRTTPEARPDPSVSHRGGPASRRGCVLPHHSISTVPRSRHDARRLPPTWEVWSSGNISARGFPVTILPRDRRP